MRTSIKLYEINTAFHEAMILCFRILLTKDFDVIKKDAIYDGAWPRPTLLGDMEFFGMHYDANKINADRS